MTNSVETALDLMTGRWRSQILHAGVKLNIVDQLGNQQLSASAIADALALDAGNTYRLMRALASIGIMHETADQEFSLTDAGELFLSAHPNSMRGVCLWEEGVDMYSAWKHLPEIVRDGADDGFKREFGCAVFDKITSDLVLGTLFNDAMTSYSQRETQQVLAALSEFDTSALKSLVDIGGGLGHLLCHFLREHPALTGTVFELAATLNEPGKLLADALAVGDRCQYQAGNMFENVPAADAYLLKHILHDWNDTECVQILSNANQAAASGGRILIAEYIVPGPEESDFSKLFDIHMMAVLTGSERTEREFASLLEKSGWTHAKTWRQPQGSLAVVEGVKK